MTNIWIDTDPGIDDSIALVAAFKNRKDLNILGVSTVAGNQTIDKVTVNALFLTHVFGASDIFVHKGAAYPLAREPRTAGHIHGEYGLGPVKPNAFTDNLSQLNAVEGMRKALSELPKGEKATLLPIGPLTNIALLLKTYPEVHEKIEKIVFMGGSLSFGNVTSTAEFNIWQDPEAAHIVLNSALTLVMCPLDLTMQCTLSEKEIDLLRESHSSKQSGKNSSSVENILYDMLHFYLESPAYREKRLVAMHDVCTVLYVLQPGLFGGDMHAVDAYMSNDICRGLTYCLDTPFSDYGAKYKQGVLVLNRLESLDEFRRILMDILLDY